MVKLQCAECGGIAFMSEDTFLDLRLKHNGYWSGAKAKRIACIYRRSARCSNGVMADVRELLIEEL